MELGLLGFKDNVIFMISFWEVSMSYVRDKGLEERNWIVILYICYKLNLRVNSIIVVWRKGGGLYNLYFI